MYFFFQEKLSLSNEKKLPKSERRSSPLLKRKNSQRKTILFNNKGVYCLTQRSRNYDKSFDEKENIQACQHSLKKRKISSIKRNRQLSYEKSVYSLKKQKKRQSIEAINKSVKNLSHFQFTNLRQDIIEKSQEKKVENKMKKSKIKPIIQNNTEDLALATIQHLLQKKQDLKALEKQRTEKSIIYEKKEENSIPQKCVNFKEQNNKILKKINIKQKFDYQRYFEFHQKKQVSLSKGKYFLVNLSNLKYVCITQPSLQSINQASIIDFFHKNPELLKNFKKNSRFMNNFSASLEKNIFICLKAGSYLQNFFIWIGKPVRHFEQGIIEKFVKEQLKKFFMEKFQEILKDLGFIVWILTDKGKASYFKIEK